MKRLFSGPKSPTLDFLSPPKPFQDAEKGGQRSRSSSFSRVFSSSDSSPRRSPGALDDVATPTSSVTPELVPIVTLLSAQAHRRYHEGIFLILKDLNSDGSPAERKWKEVYAVLLGTQLALWDARLLAENNHDPDMLMKATSKPTYINLTDANFRPLDSKENVVTGSDKKLKNSIVLSTTLKNRYFIQLSDKEAFNQWHGAMRLSAFEFTSLQEAYTGAFLSTKGSKLGDIRVILADTKFDYEDWVSVRFGAGMPWKRCYAVISQPTKKSSKGKRYCGEINFFENDKKTKKSQAMTTIKDADAMYALYPSSPTLIDSSTIIKLEGSVKFGKKDEPKQTDIFIMPEKHYAVPGYDTIIRFLVPSMNAFQLYGRPERLIADRSNFDSLLFGLPTLPHVHYLQTEDLHPLINSVSSKDWSVLEWRKHIKTILSKRLNKGYTGCGSSEGLTGALSSPAISTNELFDTTPIQTSPLIATVAKFSGEQHSDGVSTPVSLRGPTNLRNVVDSFSDVDDSERNRPMTDMNVSNGLADPSMLERKQKERVLKATKPTIEIQHSNFESIEQMTAPNDSKISSSHGLMSRKSELSNIYDKYAEDPFGSTGGVRPLAASESDNRDSVGAYDKYMGSPNVKKFDISTLRHSDSSEATEHTRHSGSFKETQSRSKTNGEALTFRQNKDDVLGDFYSLSEQIAQIDPQNSIKSKDLDSRQSEDFNFLASGNETGEDNVFDPDFMEQNQMLETESSYALNEKKFHQSEEDLTGNQQADYHDMRLQSSYVTEPRPLPKIRGQAGDRTPVKQIPGSQVDSRGKSQGGIRHSPGYTDLSAPRQDIAAARSGTVTPTKGQSQPMAGRPPPTMVPHAVSKPPTMQMPRRRAAHQQIGQQMPQQMPHQMPQHMPHQMPQPMAQQMPQPSNLASFPRPIGQNGPYTKTDGRPPYSNWPSGSPAGYQPHNYNMGPQFAQQPVFSKQNVMPRPQGYNNARINQGTMGAPSKPAQKPRSPMTGGFSQYMPSTANQTNPYVANPYSN
ncbi:LAMI_0F01772g1_1 [Lachancea mirantina]|uniref:LAMI_0F01772g1_1 n=1 Tax=Lachancea mirantina TaxID=1230905 RepID=A0A1G4JW38_9SACH|nr:LAMI_0F01772g1_1 [Lachancea mirantina]